VAKPRPVAPPDAPLNGVVPSASAAPPESTDTASAAELAAATVVIRSAATSVAVALPVSSAKVAPIAAVVDAPDAGQPAPSAAQIHAALAATPIAMYTASWCPACQQAHAFLQASGLSCTDRDVDQDPSALQELKSRTGQSSIPVLEIDGELLGAGFSEAMVERALARSVERRLGVSGIHVERL
jgi:glutaredoxin